MGALEKVNKQNAVTLSQYRPCLSTWLMFDAVLDCYSHSVCPEVLPSTRGTVSPKRWLACYCNSSRFG